MQPWRREGDEWVMEDGRQEEEEEGRERAGAEWEADLPHSLNALLMTAKGESALEIVEAAACCGSVGRRDGEEERRRGACMITSLSPGFFSSSPSSLLILPPLLLSPPSISPSPRPPADRAAPLASLQFTERQSECASFPEPQGAEELGVSMVEVRKRGRGGGREDCRDEEWERIRAGPDPGLGRAGAAAAWHRPTTRSQTTPVHIRVDTRPRVETLGSEQVSPPSLSATALSLIRRQPPHVSTRPSSPQIYLSSQLQLARLA
ncbi:unnamed protein product [Pleuronectes platessa]|uniref:Uncharacterized protein n=1 Tax=Pleuronectes platessa TaxID=8262 RepID=A0A9N7YRC9_PLEPL|nr:unnamed protein product [Pleuronectes platessa]